MKERRGVGWELCRVRYWNDPQRLEGALLEERRRGLLRGVSLPRASRREVGSHFISAVSHAHMARFMSFKGSFLCLAVPLHTKTCRFIKDKEVLGHGRSFFSG